MSQGAPPDVAPHHGPLESDGIDHRIGPVAGVA